MVRERGRVCAAAPHLLSEPVYAPLVLAPGPELLAGKEPLADGTSGCRLSRDGPIVVTTGACRSYCWQMIDEERRPDSELLAATPTERDAFAAFYRRHVAAVLAYVLARTGRPDIAADICAEVFAAALEKSGRYDERRGSARSWLLTMASSRLVDAARRGAVESRARSRLGMPAIELEDEDLERIEALLDPRLDAAGELLRDLPTDQREAISARVLQERDYSDIAASVGLSEHVIRKRVSRGLSALRTQLAEEDQP